MPNKAYCHLDWLHVASLCETLLSHPSARVRDSAAELLVADSRFKEDLVLSTCSEKPHSSSKFNKSFRIKRGSESHTGLSQWFSARGAVLTIGVDPLL